MSLAATVLIPTHDHGRTLLRSVPSALAQTVTEIEVFVVGDGVPEVTRELMAEFAASDERVRFFDNPKGPRHGEIHRHAALQEARGEIVCYLCDDDLWLPGHLAEMQALLADADLANALSLAIDPDGLLHVSRLDLSHDYYRRLVLDKGNLDGDSRIQHSVTGHTLAHYRRLPDGWRTTPEGAYVDLYFWQRLLSVPGTRAASGTRPTVIHLPSPARAEWSADERLAEMDAWAARVPELQQLVLDRTLPDRAALEEELWSNQALVRELRGQVASLETGVETRQAELERIAASATWRLRGALVRVPGLRAVAKALARLVAPATAGRSRPAPTAEPSSQATGSPAPDPPSDSQARPPDPSTR